MVRKLSFVDLHIERSLVEKLQWGIFFGGLTWLMQFVEVNAPFAVWIWGRDGDMLPGLVNIFLLMLILFPITGVLFHLYLAMYKRFTLKHRLVNRIFYIVFVIVFFPMEYFFMQLMFPFKNAVFLPDGIQSDGFLILIVIVSNMLISRAVRLSNLDKEVNMWNKVLGGLLQREFIYFVVIFLVLVVGNLLG